MDQRTFSQFIEAGQPVSITADLLSAARESAHRRRSEALRAGARTVQLRIRAVIATAVSLKPNESTIRQQLRIV